MRAAPSPLWTPVSFEVPVRPGCTKLEPPAPPPPKACTPGASVPWAPTTTSYDVGPVTATVAAVSPPSPALVAPTGWPPWAPHTSNVTVAAPAGIATRAVAVAGGLIGVLR